MSLQAILWDNDGVLVDTEHLYFEATKQTLATVGHNLTRNEYVEVSLTAGKSLFELADVDGETFERLRDERNQLYSDLLSQGDLSIPGARETLESLKDRVRMVIVTSSRRDHFQIIHRSTGFLSYFESIVDNEDYERSKPNPDPYLMGLERLGLSAESCIAVEDSARGMQAAVNAGLRCVVVPTDLTSGGDFDDAYRVVERVGDVVGIAEELTKCC